MYNPKSKKLAPLRILQVLYKHSNSNNPLLQEDIADYLKKDYDMQLERKAISRNLNFLRDAGFYIESIPKRGTYFNADLFNDDELRLLIDAVISSEHIENEHAKKLIEKIRKFGSKKFKFNVNNVNNLNCIDYECENNSFALFDIVSEIDWEISLHYQIEFDYIRTDTDGKTFKEKHKVIPRQIIYHNHTYYLLAYNDENLVFYDLKNIPFYDHKSTSAIKLIKQEENSIYDSSSCKEAERLAIAAFFKET